MTDLYLIAHKVRGEPAFDVATKMQCPECAAQGCNECDNTGWWWIIPTSGHRAYPYWHQPLLEHYICLLPDGNWAYTKSQESMVDGLMPDMPPDLPDHYPPRAEPQRSLVDLLGIKAKPQAPSAPIKRRF